MTERPEHNLEATIQAARREKELAALERAVENYYSSLSDGDIMDLAHWAEFAELEFPGDDQSGE